MVVLDLGLGLALPHTLFYPYLTQQTNPLHTIDIGSTWHSLYRWTP
jgi:hypothetical protein